VRGVAAVEIAITLPVAVSFPADGTETARVSTFFLIVWETIEMAVEQPVTSIFVVSWISAPFWATKIAGPSKGTGSSGVWTTA